MHPEIWGPHLWHFLHTMSLTYAKHRHHATKKEKKNMYQFLYYLQFTLPCASCRTNYASYFERNPPQLNTRRQLFEWLVDLHNAINRQKRKPIFTYLQVEQLYKQIYHQ